LQLNGDTILDHQIDALQNANIEKIYVVTGYKSEMIEKHINTLDRVTIIRNDRFETTDNAYSLLIALKEVNPDIDSVIVLDGDIVFDPELLNNLSKSQHQNIMIVDNSKTITDEDCKVSLKDDYAIAIGKQVDGQAVYTSMIKMSGQFLDALKIELQAKHTLPEWYSQPLNRLITKQDSAGINEMHIMYSGNLYRCEVDNLDDFVNARNVYKKILEKHSKGGTFNK
jgi:choline kinase